MMVVDLPRRWRWAIAATCVVALVLLAVFISMVRSRVDAAAASAARTGARAVGSVALAAGSEPQLAQGGAAASRGSDEVEVCGGAWVRQQPDGSLDPEEVERATHVRQTREQIVANLSADTSELGRATALLLAITGSADMRFAALHEPAVACGPGGCPPAGSADEEVRTARDALARMASTTSDPRVYALAFKLCQYRPTDSACQLVNVEQWARLDPDNAFPWLQKLSSARTRAAQDEALHRIATAQRSDSGYFATTGAILGVAADDDASMPGVLSSIVEVLGMEAAVATPAYQRLVNVCKGPALRDSNRSQTCAAVADVLAERSDTQLGRMIGGAIGRQVGWPPDRSDRMRGEYLAYIESRYAVSNDQNDPSCDRIRRDLDELRRRAPLGEVGELREWVAESGMSPEEFIRKGRERTAAVAASEASAASR